MRLGPLHVLGFCALLVSSAAALHCFQDVVDAETPTFELEECDGDAMFCALLINDNGIRGPEKYRACATPRMCQKEGHFRLLMHNALHHHCCKGDGCNSAMTHAASSTLAIFIPVLLFFMGN